MRDPDQDYQLRKEQESDALRTALAQLDEARAERKILQAELGGQNADAAVADWRALRARAEAAEARLEELTRERDEAKADALQWAGAAGKCHDAYQDVHARLEEAKAVLKFYAEGGDDYGKKAVAFLHQGGSDAH